MLEKNGVRVHFEAGSIEMAVVYMILAKGEKRQTYGLSVTFLYPCTRFTFNIKRLVKKLSPKQFRRVRDLGIINERNDNESACTTIKLAHSWNTGILYLKLVS